MAKEKKVLTEREHLINKARLSEVVNNTKTPLVIGGKTYHIGALTYYAKWRISDLITRLELEDDSITTLIQAMAKNVPLMAEILAIAIIVERRVLEDGVSLEKLKWELTECADDMEWGNALKVIFDKLDTGFFFGLTEMVRMLNGMNDKAGYRKEAEKMKSQGDGYAPIQSLVR